MRDVPPFSEVVVADIDPKGESADVYRRIRNLAAESERFTRSHDYSVGSRDGGAECLLPTANLRVHAKGRTSANVAHLNRQSAAPVVVTDGCLSTDGQDWPPLRL